MRPDEMALVQPARAQPQAEAVVHEHLHAVGAAVGKEIGMVCLRSTEDLDDARQGSVDARAHVDRFGGQPDRLDADHGPLTGATRATRRRRTLPPAPASAPRRWRCRAGARYECRAAAWVRQARVFRDGS